MITVCKDCPKRHPGCHGACEWYKAERKALDKENTRRRNESAAICSSRRDKNGVKTRNKAFKRCEME